MTVETLADPIEAILSRAEERARQGGLAYRGALTPEEAWTLLQARPEARLVDVRSKGEWEFVGRVPGAIEVELKRYPGWEPNPQFCAELCSQVGQDALVLFLCRSAARSHEAAQRMAREGYANCFNVLEGFEGDRSGARQRTVNGWKVRGLPWFQA